MRRKRREFSIFTLSFLDIMSCGFGAVVLLFMISKHAATQAVETPTYDYGGEVSQLQSEKAATESSIANLHARAAARGDELTTASATADDGQQHRHRHRWSNAWQDADPCAHGAANQTPQ